VNSVHEGKKCKKMEKVQKIGKKRERVFPEWQIIGYSILNYISSIICDQVFTTIPLKKKDHVTRFSNTAGKMYLYMIA